MVKTYCFDIDGTICTNTDGQYESAKPFKERIEQVNKLFNNGNKIIEIRGRGLMLGLKFSCPTDRLVDLFRNNGLLTVPAGDNVIRLLPPLVIKEEDIFNACNIIDETLKNWEIDHA